MTIEERRPARATKRRVVPSRWAKSEAREAAPTGGAIMSIKMNDLYVKTLAQGLMLPGEQLLGRTSGDFQSFWTFKIPFFRHSYLLLATSNRLIVLDHRKGLIHDRLDKIESYPWSAIGSMKLSGLGFSKKLVVRDGNVPRPIVVKIKGGLMSNGVLPGAKLALATWEQQRGLGGRQPASLPAAQIA
jgi:hypothetical protein